MSPGALRGSLGGAWGSPSAPAYLLRECRRRQTLLQMFLEIQLQAAYADGTLHTAEAALLRRMAEVVADHAEELAIIEAEEKYGGTLELLRLGYPSSTTRTTLHGVLNL